MNLNSVSRNKKVRLCHGLCLLCVESGKSGEFASAQMKIATSLVAQFGGQLKDGMLTLTFLTVMASIY